MGPPIAQDVSQQNIKNKWEKKPGELISMYFIAP